MKKWLLWLILTIIIALIIFRITQFQMHKGKEVMANEVPTVVAVQKVERDSIVKTVSYAGNIVGEEQVNVYPMEETGRLIKYLVREGDRVSKGSVIAIVDRSIKGLNFQPARITSPISGIVCMLFLDKGATVAPQIPLAMISNINKVKVEIQIPEDDLLTVKKGQLAKVKVDLYPDTIFTGILRKITPVINPLSRTAKGEIVIKNPEQLLKPGMFARVEVIVEKHKNTFVVPEKAVLTMDNKKIVFVVNGNIAEKLEVKTGLKSNGKVEIIKGLKEGEQVIVTGNYGLVDGAKIKVRNRKPIRISPR